MGTIDRLRAVPGPPSESAGITLAALAGRVVKNHAVVATGIHQGRAVCYLAHGAANGKGARVYAVGTARNHQVAAITIRQQGLAGQATLIRDSVAELAERWTGAKVGLLYLDGDHSYDGVRAEFAAWRPHLSADAVVAVSGYAGDIVKDTRRAVDSLVNDSVLGPVEVSGGLAVTALTPPAPEAKPPAKTAPKAAAKAAAKTPAKAAAKTPPPPTGPVLESLNVGQLINLANERKIELRSGMRKADIIEALQKVPR